MYCPKCGSTRLRRSHTRGFIEKIFKSLGYKAFRCREKDCDWRGLVRTNQAEGSMRRFLDKCKAPFILVVVMLFSCLLLLLMVSSDFLT
jgi:hypothetical protein